MRFYAIFAFSMLSSFVIEPAAAQSPIKQCNAKPSAEEKLKCVMDALETNYVYVGQSIRLNNETGPRKGCLAATDPAPPPSVVVKPMPCDKDPRQYWKIELVPK